MYNKILLWLWLMLAAIPVAFTQSGTLDPSFGDLGITQIDFDQTGTADDVASILRFDSKGRTVICGTSGNGSYVGSSFSGSFWASVIVRLTTNHSPDSTFDGDGILILSKFGFRDFFINPDDKIILVDNPGGNEGLIIKQINTDGSPDSTFGNKSEILIPDLSYSASILDNNGKLLVAGTNWIDDTNYYNIVRFNTDGSYDYTFGVDGKILIPSLNGQSFNFRLMNANDKILLVGKIETDYTMDDFYIVRLNMDGSADSTFNNSGTFIFRDSKYDDEPSIAAVDDIGRILIGGGSSEISYERKFFSIVRLNYAGSIDSTFNGSGKLDIPGITGSVRSILFDNNGNILFGGRESFYYDSPVNMVKINDYGNLDTTFGTNGKISIFRMYDYKLDSDNKILLAGSTDIFINPEDSLLKHERDFKIIRLDTNGASDQTFGSSGEILIPIGNGGDEARNMAFDNNGKIVLAGYSIIEGYNAESSIARLNPDGSTDNSFFGYGKEILKGSDFDDYIVDVKIDSLNRIITASNVYNNASGFQYGYIRRLNYDGSIDSSYKTSESNFQHYSFIKILTNHLNDKILLVYRYWNDSVYYGIKRLNNDGSIDSAFANKGVLILNNSFNFSLAAIDNNDRIVASHTKWLNGHSFFEIFRFNPDGSIDSTFNGSGKQMITNDFERNDIGQIETDRNNNILIAGFSGSVDHIHNLIIIRLNQDGSRDSTFGNEGYIVKPGFSDPQPVVSIISGNRILLAYSHSSSLGTGFNMERLNPDGSPDTSFGQMGKMKVSDGYFRTMKADSNYIWMAGSDEGDYKIIKLYARNNQHIVFSLPDTVQYGDAAVILNGVASSGLPVTYTSSNPAIAFISHDTLLMAGPGTVTITARQSGDGSFYSADPVSRSLVVKSTVSGLPAYDPDAKIRVYPNPVSNTLFLESSGMIRSATLTGMEGSVIYERTDISNKNFSMDMSGYKPGCYILIIRFDEDYAIQVRKVLKL